jgi:hypothetical protein
MSILALAKITVKVDPVTKPIEPVKQMLLDKVKDVPDDYIIDYKDVKTTYPDIASKLENKFFSKKKQLTIKELKELIKDMQVDEKFWLSEVPYTQGAQKQLNKEQIVIQLNFTPEMVSEIKKSKPTYDFLSYFFEQYEGKHQPLGNQTFAWARVYKFDPEKIWIIEEMQTDFIGWDKDYKLMIPTMEDKLKKYTEQEQKEILDFFKKHFGRWEHKFLTSIMQMARSKGIAGLWLFDESHKQSSGASPSKMKWYYREVPKDMGMKKENTRIGDKEFMVWKKALAKLKENKVLSALSRVI